MANDLLLIPKELQLRLETCPKCGYNRQVRDAEYSSTFECPKCGIVYALAMEDIKKHNHGLELQDEAELGTQKITSNSSSAEIRTPQIGGAVFTRRERVPPWISFLVILGCLVVVGFLLL